MRRFVVGTAGHIDHGKTALVAALTGEDTDRLPEEKARGISIDLGFSHLEVQDVVLSLVDAPGHEDFIRNMLAGATGIDVLLLVVAADEGVMPQTREHLAIAGLLAVPHAVVALTKADLVEDEWLELVRDEVAGLLAETRYRDAPMVPTSATTGVGLDTLREALLEAGADATRDPDDLFRLPIDRVFTIRGTGTVVTGTVWSGGLALENEVRILPGDGTARVRGLQVHGSDTGRVEAGQRAAVALGGVDRVAITRGATLVADGAWQPGAILTARLEVIPGTGWRIQQRQRVRVHLGTSEVMARVRLLQGSVLGGGDSGWAQLRLESPLVARAGDRLVIRSYSPVTTIGGGRIAESGNRKRKRLLDGDVETLAALADGPADVALRARLRDAGVEGARAESLPLDVPATPQRIEDMLDGIGAVGLGDRAFEAGAVERVQARLREALEAYHMDQPLSPGMELEELRRNAPARSAPALVEAAIEALRTAGAVVLQEGRAAAPDFRPRLTGAQERLRTAILDAVRAAGTEAPSADELQAAVGGGADLQPLLRLLEIDGSVVRIGPALYMDRATADSLIADIQNRLGGRQELGPADFRAVIPVSRKYLIPILEHLDARGITVRQGEGRSVPATP